MRKTIKQLLETKPTFALRLLFFSALLFCLLLGVRWSIWGYIRFQGSRIASEALPVKLERLKTLTQKLPVGVHKTWLESRFELGQSYAEFKEQVIPAAQNSHIQLQSLGKLSKEQKEIFQISKEYLSLFYCMPVKVAPSISEDTIPTTAQRFHPENSQQQYETVYIIDTLLAKHGDQKAVMNIALSSLDLFPRESLSFVFGQANPEFSSAVASLHRFGNPRQNFTQVLRRTLRTLSHEAAHTANVKHCISGQCVMNGSLSLDEADSKPLALCASCMAKVLHFTKCDATSRLESLKAFFLKHKLHFEAEMAASQLEAIRH